MKSWNKRTWGIFSRFHRNITEKLIRLGEIADESGRIEQRTKKNLTIRGWGVLLKEWTCRNA